MRRLFLALVLSSLPVTALAQTPATSTAVRLLREACVETDMDRARYDEVAARKGWTSRSYAPPADTPNDWGSLYFAGPAQILMIGSDRVVREGNTTYPAFRSCNVVVVNPAQDWREDLEVLALELGFRRYDPGRRSGYARFPEGQGQEWRRRDGFISWSHDPADGILSLEIYRGLEGSSPFLLR